MTTYFRGFEEADGISDFTEIAMASGHTAPAWSIVNTNEVQATSASSHHEALVWNDIDGDANRANVEILCQVYVNATAVAQRCVALRISTSGASRTGYSLTVRTASVQAWRSTGSTFTSLASTGVTITSGTWCWVRFRANSTAIQARVWADGDSEPGTWTVDTTDATYSTAGHVGLLKAANTSTQLWRKLGVGTNGDTAPASAGGGSTNLTVADALHAHAADNVVLTSQTAITIADALHAHVADNVVLTSQTAITIADALHAHVADNVVLEVSGAANLTVADALHAHTADNLILTSQIAIVVADALHAHTADGLTLTAASVLALQDALHAHAADNLTLELSGGITLTLADALHAHTADGVLLTMSAYLVVSDALHAHTADNILLSIPGAFRAGNPRVWILNSRQRYSMVDSRRRVVHLN